MIEVLGELLREGHASMITHLSEEVKVKFNLVSLIRNGNKSLGEIGRRQQEP